mmetsp:Transcript_15634/g.21394  ORF Transcript_15634/g.21394 Transcript_15634/m.21394 type:complete len:302 (-) Transcript_15634:431-1336(-)
MTLSGAIVNIESQRWNLHYLDASTADQGQAKPGKGNVYVTDGNPNHDWAKWRIVDCGNGEVNFESIRWGKHFLDASTGDFADGGPGKGNVYVTDGNPAHEWARWKIIDKGGGIVWIESVRWPGHYLDASTGEVGKGHVYVTTPGDNANMEWANWKINVQSNPTPDGIISINAHLIPIVMHHGGVGTGQYTQTEEYYAGLKSDTYSSSSITDISSKAYGKIDVVEWSAEAEMNISIKQAFHSAATSTMEEDKVTKSFSLSFEKPFYVYQGELFISTAHGSATMKGRALVFSGEPLVQVQYSI